MEYEWSFSFARVRLEPNTLTVENPSTKFGQFEKDHEDAMGVLGKEARGILKKAWGKDKSFQSFVAKDELKVFFDRIGETEGVTAKEVEEAPAPVAATYAPSENTGESTAAGDSKYVVKIDETVDYKVDHKGEVLDSAVNGSLVVDNKGDKNRIWDIDLKLSGSDNTDLSVSDYHILELDPEEKWEQTYSINVEAATPPLKITENIDTFPDTEEDSHTFIQSDSKESECWITITLENTGDKRISDVELTKELPSEFSNVKALEKDGDVDSSSDLITWKLDSVAAKNMAKLKFKVKVDTSEIKTINSGEIKVKYVLAEGTFSGLNIDFIDGLSNNIYYIDRDEREEEPDVWDCKFVFENRSEFPFRIQNVELKSGDYNTEEKTFTHEPDVIVMPGQEWASEPWDVESEDLPTFGENVQFTVEPQIITQLSASTTITPVSLMILSLKGKKEFSKNKIASYRKETLEATIDVRTTGKAPIDEIRISDTIPMDFENPADVTVIIEEKTVETSDVSLSFEPSGDNLDIERKMIVEVRDILDHIGELDAETSMVLKYPLNAVRPAKDARYDAPVLFQAYTKPKGPVIECYIEPEPIEVIHQRRRLTVGKSVMPGSDKGLYDILLLYKNRGDGPETEIVIQDMVPENFTLRSANPEPEQMGNLLTWKFESIDPDQKVDINYTIEGQGEYRARDAQIFHKA